jgi:hypothetical protein
MVELEFLLHRYFTKIKKERSNPNPPPPPKKKKKKKEEEEKVNTSPGLHRISNHLFYYHLKWLICIGSLLSFEVVDLYRVFAYLKWLICIVSMNWSFILI